MTNENLKIKPEDDISAIKAQSLLRKCELNQHDVERLAHDHMKWHFQAEYSTFLDYLIFYDISPCKITTCFSRYSK